MTSSKRERDLARQKQVRQAQKDAKAAEARRRNRLIGGGILAAALVIGGGFFIANALGSSDSPDTSAAAATSSPGATSVKCEKPPTLQTTAKQFPNGPEGITLTQAVLGLKIDTNCGPIEMNFESTKAPNNTKAMIFLANTGAPILKIPGDNTSGTKDVQGYFDKTPCHRLTTAGIFVLQCGDPTGTGTGGPGFTTPDENLPTDFKKAGNGSVIYPRGTIAMANSGPNTNGSQFFIVYKDSPLPPNYVVLGEVTKGLEVVDKVAAAGVQGGGTDGAPKEAIALTKVLSFETREVAAP